jgi:hypothetical protein
VTSIAVTPAAVATVPAATSMTSAAVASAMGRESAVRDESAAQY